MATNSRSEARSVILRLRRYRDRMQDITASVSGASSAADAGMVQVQRKFKALKTDLDNDAHECAIGSKRAVQTECEQQFLWPAVREAAGAIRDTTFRHTTSLDTGTSSGIDLRSRAELRTAQVSIQHYLGQLEVLYPTM